MNAPIPRERLEYLARLVAEVRRREEVEGLSASLAGFTRAAWPQLERKTYLHNWHIDAIAEHLEAVTDGEIKRLIINVPFRTMKSTLVSVAWPAWTWTFDPSHQFLCGSHAEKLATRDNLKHRRLITSPWYRSRWGNKFVLTGDQNQKLRFENDQNGYRIGFGMTAGITGDGGDTIIVDDPHDRDKAQSDVERQRALETFDQSIVTRLNDPEHSAIVVIMQRLHQTDLSGHLLEHGGWEHLMLPMEYDPGRAIVTGIGFRDPRTERGELLWPERFPEPVVRELKQTLGPYGASGQLQQEPTPAGGGIFKADWWKVWPPNGEELDRNGNPKRPLEFPPMDYIVMAVDTALTENEENDWSAASVWGVFTDPATQAPAIMLMEAWQDRLELRPLVDKIMKTAAGTGSGRAPVDMVLVEAKMNGHSVAQEIRRLCRKGSYAVRLDPVKGDKVARAYSVQHLFSSGLVYAPNRKYADMVIEECAGFPKRAHDDIVDTVTAALRYLRSMNLAQFGDEYREELAARFGPSRTAQPLYPV